MGRYDCVVLFNEATIEEIEGSQEKTYPSTVLREEVGAIEEVLREGGFNPYLLVGREFFQRVGSDPLEAVSQVCLQPL